VLIGETDARELVSDPPALAAFATESLTLPGATVLQLITEIRVAGREASLPPSLHPTNPPSAVLLFWDCPTSPWGPFRMAQGRVACRSGLRPRGFVQACVVDNPAARQALRNEWGLPAELGKVTLDRGYDRVIASAARDGKDLVSVLGRDPDPLASGDIAYTTTVALADTPRGLRLVQLDCDYAMTRAERLRPAVSTFAVGAWMVDAVVPSHPISASVALGDVTLQPHRYVSTIDELAFTGTETVA
jgi:hypothetical protein